MEFVWDEGKNRANREKHGISFEEVVLCLAENGPLAVLPNDAYPGQQLVVFRLSSGDIGVAAVEPRDGRIRIVTAQRRRKMRKRYGSPK